MKKNIKLFAFILATLMLVSFIPLATFAEEIETGAENTETETVEGSSPEQEEAVSEPEDTSQHENNGFSLPEDSENVHYERLPNGFIKVTVYPNVTESEANGGNSLSVPGHINIDNSLEDPTPMAFGPGFDETIIDGGDSITYPSDTYISSLSPTTNYGSATEAFVNDENFLFISYPMPYIPEYATIVEATLNIAYRYKSNQSASVSAYRVNIYWQENTFTWNSTLSTYGMGIDSTVLCKISSQKL